MNITINKPFSGFKAGDTVSVKVDASGIPLSQFWRRRFADAKTDDCIEFPVQQTKKIVKQKEAVENDNSNS